MAKRVIPEQIIFICDACKFENKPNANGNRLHMTWEEPDSEKSTQVFKGLSWDLCDKCAEKLKPIIIKEIEIIERGPVKAK